MDGDKLNVQDSGEIPIPYGGLGMEPVKAFYQFRKYYRLNYPYRNYPGDLSFNVFLDKLFVKNNKLEDHIYISSVYSNIDKEAVPVVDWRTDYGVSRPGTIANPKGGRVLKVMFFDKLKKMWNHNPTKLLTDFEFNEFLSKKFAGDKYFNLSDYLIEENKKWRRFIIRYPDVVKKNFKSGTADGDYNIYYKDTPIEVFGDHVSKKFNDRVKKALGLSTSFPLSLQSTLEKYPIPGTDYLLKPSSMFHEFKISVSSDKSFQAKFSDVFKESTITFQSAAQCNRWLHGPNFNYWPQQLNVAVWCATSGCGISLNEDYPDRIQEFINFHIYFTIRRILWKLKIPLPDDN